MGHSSSKEETTSDTNTTKTVAATVTNKAGEAKDKVVGWAKKLWDGDKMALIIFILVVVFTFIAIILYIIYALRSNNLTASKVNQTPIEINTIQTPTVFDSGLLPKPLSGTEFALSFWVYIDNIQQTYQTNYGSTPQNVTTNGQLILFQSGSAVTLGTANFVTFMDSTSNKMYIAIKTINNSLDSTCNGNVQNIITNNYYMNTKNSLLQNLDAHINNYVIIAIDYVPLQRWVNLSVIIDNKLITTMIDGEIYSIQTTDQIQSSRPVEYDANNNPLTRPVIIDMPSGNLYVGKNPQINNGIVASGYVGNINYWNYAPSISDLKNFYNNGPIGGWSLLRKLGIAYGVRSPVYKLN